MIEGSGALATGGNLRLGQLTATNIVVTLTSSDPALVTVPASATILAGQTNVTFELLVGDNAAVTPSQPVTITAQVSGFGAVSNTAQVLENDAHHLRFSALDWLQTTNAGLGVLLTAEDAQGNRLTNFAGSAELRAVGLSGGLPLTPTNTGSFNAGQCYLSVQVLEPAVSVRLHAVMPPGQSDAFNVGLPVFWAAPQAVSDVAWHEGSQTLFATVPATGGVYSNRLVAIDPATGLVTNSYPLGGTDAGQIELAPSANWLYVALSNSFALQRFDINTRVAGLKFALGSNPELRRFAYDFCVPSGLADSVVVETRDQDVMGSTYRAGLARYDGGVPVALPNFDASGGWLLESLPSGSQVLLSSPLAKGNAATGAILATATNTLRSPIKYRDGFVYDDGGNFYSAAHLGWLGAYPGVLEQVYHTALVEVIPARRRMFYLAGYFNFGASFYKLRVYDRDLLQPLFQLSVPSSAGAPARFISYGSNRLAYVTGNRELWFIRPDLIQSDAAPADLHLSITSAMPVAVVGTDYNFTLTLSNAGPGLASIVRITNSLPANVTVLATSTSTGSVALANSAFTWTVAPLPPGSNATLYVTARFGTAGWQTNLAVALGFETDPVAANNIATLPLYVELPPQGLGVFPINAATEDLCYDPGRDRLLLSVGSAPGGQNNGLAVFDPYRGVMDSFTSLTKRPTRMARSDDGQFLYVSLPDEALVRRLTLTNLSQNLEFALGGEDIFGVWYPFYAADLAVVPGQPESLVAWRVRRAGPMASEYGWGLGVFDDGVMRPNVTAAGGNWRVEFDADAGTLFGFNNGDLRRCTLDAGGVSFAETFPQFYSAGDDVEYASGQLFSTAGRAIETNPFRVAWLVAGAETATLVEPDAAANRIYYLIQTNGWQIKVHELDSRRWLGSLPVPNVVGTPSSLIRWGTNGLAFRTSSNQLYVIRSPLIQPEASAAVAVQLSGPATPVQPGEDAVITLNLTNSGPASASDLQITNLFSPAVAIVAANPSAGTSSTNGGQIVWSLPTLVAGEQATLTYTIRASSTGVVTITASATVPTPDAVLGNNTAVLALQVGGAAANESMAVLKLAANDLAWSPALGRLLVTASNSAPNWSGALLSVEPVTHSIRFETTLGGDAGRLAISSDGGRVHAGVDYGLNTLTLPDLTITNRFLINPSDPRARVYDMDVVPGTNSSVLVGSRSLNNNSTWLGVYDSGTQRTNIPSFFSTGFSLEFGADPQVCYYQDHAAGGFRRYAVQTNGLVLLDTDTTLLPGSTAITLAWADGQLFTSPGILIDPISRTRVGNAAAITNNSAVCYDSQAGRAYFVSTVGTNAYLQAIDKATLVAVGSRVIPGVTGTAASLVRWGTNGLAFRTTGGQVGLLRTELIPSGAPVDLALGMIAPQPLAIVGSNFVYSLSVTNIGYNPAPDSQVLFRISTNATIAAATASVGTCVTNSSQLVANLGLLAPGGSATVSVTIVPTQPGTLAAVASVISGAPDPVLANNSQALTNSAALLLAPGATTILTQTANDLAYNPLNGRLYVSGAAGGISVINPSLALIETNWAMPSAPTRLVMSDNAQYLYAALDAGRRVGRINTTNGGLELDFSLGTNGATPYTLQDFAAVPSDSRSLAVIKQAGGSPLVQILDDGVLRPGVQLATVVNHLEFGATTDVLYGTGLRQFLIGPTNLTLQVGAIAAMQTENLEFEGGQFFTTGGKRVEAASRVIVGSYAGLGTGTLVEPDLANGRVFFLTRVSTTWQVRAYDPSTFAFLGSTTVTNVLGNPTNFVRWGADGLAFCTTSSQVFLMRSPLVPAGPAADLAVTQTTSGGPFLVGSNITFTLTVTNAGPNPATNVVLLNRFPTNAVVFSITNSQGSITQAAGVVTCLLGTLTNGASAQVQLTLRPGRAGNFSNLGVVTSAASDPLIANNSAIATVPVQFNLAPDSVGVVDLQTTDLAFDPVSGFLYATPTNHPGELASSVVTINPATGLMGVPLPVGPQLSGMAITDDGAKLYVLANNGAEFRRVNLADGVVDLQVPFSAATGQAGSFADEIKPVPQQSGALAAVLRFPGVLGGYSPSLVVYDEANPRPALAAWQNTFEFFSPNRLIGLYWNSVPQQTARIELTSTGFVAQASAGALLDGQFLANGAGLIYSSGGSVFDPLTLTKLRSFGVSGPAAPDPSVNRVAFLTGSGSGTKLRVFDTLGILERGTLAITNAQGTATKLLRCGADRFAFRTSAGQIIIVRSSAIPTGPATDLALGLSNATPTPTAQQPFALTLLVTNLGPALASSVMVSNALPASMKFLSAAASQGAVTGAASALLWQVGDLAPGAVATNQLLLVPQAGGAFALQSIVYGNIADANGLNDVAGTTWLVHNAAPPTALSVLALSAGDLVWEPLSQRLVLSVTAPSPAVSNTLLRLDPISGLFETPILVGQKPGKLAISDNGQHAYVGQDQNNTLAKVQLNTGQVLTNYASGKVLEIELPPSDPNLFVLLQEGNLDAYLNGAELPLTGNVAWDGPSSLTRPNAAGRFYGYVGSRAIAYFTPTFYRMTVNNSGWVINDTTENLLAGAETTIESANGLVFASSGTVLQPETLTTVTNLPDLAANSLVRPDPASGWLSFLTPKNGGWWLRQYSHTNYVLVREFRVPGVSGTPKSLVRWGTDGLAFLTTSNQVYLVRPPLAYADLALTHQSWPTQAIAGQSFQVVLAVTNHGSAFAADAFVTNTPPAFTTVLNASASQGSVILTNNRAIFALGDVATNTAVTLTVTLLPTNTIMTTLTNSTVAINAFPDLSLTNNTSAVSITALADRDNDGIPDNWETAYGLNPTNAIDGALDSDCDGLTNLQEYQAGRNPVLFENPRLTTPRLTVSGKFEATLEAGVGKQYTIEASTNFIHWQPVTTVLTWAQSQTVQIPTAAATPASFFRLRTDTNAPRPVLTLLNPAPPFTNAPLIRVAAPPGRFYALQASTNLSQWTTISNYFGLDCSTVMADPTTNLTSRRFYRILVP